MSAAALAAAPAAALAAGYTIDVSATGGTLSGASAIDAGGQAVSGSSIGAGTYQIAEGSPGPFTIVGTGSNASGTTVGAVYFGETVSQATYTGSVNLALPSVAPTAVAAPGSIALTAGAAQTVAISVYSATYGAVGDGALLALTPSAGLTLTAAGSEEAQVAQSVYAATVAGVVYADLSAVSAGSYTLTVDAPPGTALTGGAIPVTVAAPSGGGSPTSGSGTPGSTTASSGAGSTVTVDGASGTVVLDATFDASTAQTLTSSDGALTLDVPAGAIAGSGTVVLQVVEFGSGATAQLLASSGAASYEQSLGLSFLLTATVNGTTVSTFALPISALFNLASVSGTVSNAADVDLLGIGSGTLAYLGGKSGSSGVAVSLPGFTSGPDVLMEVARSFPDVTASYWAASDINLMASKFVVQGFPDGDFEPAGEVTRAQFTAMLLRMLAIPVDPAAAPAFTDVPSNAWYYGDVATAAEKGIVEGVSSTSFQPNAPITREELVTMFVRAAELEGWLSASQATAGTQTMDSTFTDAARVDSWAQADMAVAVAAGLVQGRTATTLVPLGETTRAEAATWAARLFQQFL